MPPGDADSLTALTTSTSEPARSLIAVIDEAIEAQRDMEHGLRAALGLNNTDYRALMEVLRRGRRGLATHPRDLTRALGVGTGATSQIVGRLVASGLLSRSEDPHDARAGLLGVTESGAGRLAASTVELRRELDELVVSLGGEEEARLIELLDRARDIYRAHRRPSA